MNKLLIRKIKNPSEIKTKCRPKSNRGLKSFIEKNEIFLENNFDGSTWRSARNIDREQVKPRDSVALSFLTDGVA